MATRLIFLIFIAVYLSSCFDNSDHIRNRDFDVPSGHQKGSDVDKIKKLTFSDLLRLRYPDNKWMCNNVVSISNTDNLEAMGLPDQEWKAYTKIRRLGVLAMHEAKITDLMDKNKSIICRVFYFKSEEECEKFAHGSHPAIKIKQIKIDSNVAIVSNDKSRAGIINGRWYVIYWKFNVDTDVIEGAKWLRNQCRKHEPELIDNK